MARVKFVRWGNEKGIGKNVRKQKRPLELRWKVRRERGVAREGGKAKIRSN